ncbi:MAG: alpha/beta hydrolase [Chitinophagaceae bacterium]|nr:MAG: alpha/beta hydrolase [Chitinophagaceae bacterium]
MTLYFLSGLGADRRVFGRLQLPGPYRIVHLDWIEPLPRESLEHYALRLSAGINTNEPFALIGLSFGGMLAVEIARVLRPTCLILISSAVTCGELPSSYRTATARRLAGVAPLWLFKIQHAVLEWFFGAGDQDSRTLLRSIFRDSNAAFNKWAVGAILSWRNSSIPHSPLYRIHGDKDRILPIGNMKINHVVKGGGHLAVFSNADVVSPLIVQCLEESTPRA